MSKIGLGIALQVWAFARQHAVIIAKVAAVGGVAVAAYAWVDGRGYERAERKYLTIIEKTEAANVRAVEAADKVYADRIRTLNIQNKELEDALAENAAERAKDHIKDPGSPESGFNPRRVQRLNRVR